MRRLGGIPPRALALLCSALLLLPPAFASDPTARGALRFG